MQDKILHHRDQVADDDEQTALPNPLGGAGMLTGKIVPEFRISMVIFFFVNKIIFPEGEAQKT